MRGLNDSWKTWLSKLCIRRRHYSCFLWYTSSTCNEAENGQVDFYGRIPERIEVTVVKRYVLWKEQPKAIHHT